MGSGAENRDVVSSVMRSLHKSDPTHSPYLLIAAKPPIRNPSAIRSRGLVSLCKYEFSSARIAYPRPSFSNIQGVDGKDGNHNSVVSAEVSGVVRDSLQGRISQL